MGEKKESWSALITAIMYLIIGIGLSCYGMVRGWEGDMFQFAVLMALSIVVRICGRLELFMAEQEIESES